MPLFYARRLWIPVAMRSIVWDYEGALITFPPGSKHVVFALFQVEMLLAGRRRRGHFLRWLYLAFLLAQVAPLFSLSRFGWERFLTGLDVYAFFEGFLTQHYVLLALLTPALAGGTITEEKTRGTLE